MQWCEKGSVMCKKPPGWMFSVCTPENIAQVLASIGRSPRRFASKYARALGMSGRSVWCILHSDLNLHAYKLQTVHSLSDRDKEVHLQFFRYRQGMLTENPDLPNNLLLSSEARFHMHSTINKQNI